LRRLARGAGRVLLGGSVVLFCLAIALFGVGLYLASVPYARISKRHAQLQAFVGLAQAGAALLAVMRTAEPTEPTEPT